MINVEVSFEEDWVLNFLRARRGQEVKRWDVVGPAARAYMVHYDVRRLDDAKDQILTLCRRLIREKKIRYHKKTRTYRVSELFCESLVVVPLVHSIEDACCEVRQ